MLGNCINVITATYIVNNSQVNLKRDNLDQFIDGEKSGVEKLAPV
jgi:hypothetical protein